MVCHLPLESIVPARVRRLIRCQQPVALPHAAFVAGGRGGMIWLRGIGQPVEKAAACRCAFRKQPVHGGCQPHQRQPLRQRRGGGIGFVDPHALAIRGGRVRADAQGGVAKLGEHRKTARPLFARHDRQGGAPQSPAGRQHGNRLQHIGLAGAVGAGEQNEARGRRNVQLGVIAKIGQGQPGNRHPANPCVMPCGVSSGTRPTLKTNMR